MTGETKRPGAHNKKETKEIEGHTLQADSTLRTIIEENRNRKLKISTAPTKAKSREPA